MNNKRTPAVLSASLGMYAANINISIFLWHFLKAPGKIVNQIEIRLNIRRKNQIIFRNDFKSFHERSGIVKGSCGTNYFAMGHGHVLAGVLTLNVFAKLPIRLPIQG